MNSENSMKLRLREQDDVVVITIEGNILQENVTVFRNRLNDLIDSGKRHLVLNMVGTNYISSLCLAAMIEAKNRLSPLHGDIKIALVNRLIRNLLEITNLTKKIEIHESVESAVASFAEPNKLG